MKKKKFKEVKQYKGISLGLATSFNAKKEYDIKVLNIFPEGNDYTTPEKPYYIKCEIRGLRYFGREHFKGYHILYYYNFSVGMNTHMVQIYDKYSDEQGLQGNSIKRIEYSRAKNVLREAKYYLTDVQKEILKEAMKNRNDLIILSNGKIGR